MLEPSHLNTETNRPTIGVMLTGLGYRALAALPLFELLDQENIPIDVLIGASGGAQVCIQKSLGWENKQIIDSQKAYLDTKPFSKLDYKAVASMFSSRFGHFDESKGALKKEPLLQRFHDLFGDRQFEDLDIPTIVQATDLVGKEGVALTSGSLAEAAYASAALYPFFPPLYLDDKWLVDGSLVMPFPLLKAMHLEVDIIIALLAMEEGPIHPTRFVEGFQSAINWVGMSILRSQFALTVDLHDFEIIPIYVKCKEFVASRKTKHIDAILDWGQTTVDARKEEILHIINHFKKA